MIHLDVDQSLLLPEQNIAEGIWQRIEKEANRELDGDGAIAIRFVTDQEMRRLNRMYRKKDTTTDVLSFSYVHEPGPLLGDLALSYVQAQKQAHGEVLHEIIMLSVHGILHIFGHDHEEAKDAEKMFPIQDRMVDAILQDMKQV